jgi:hypothetical protein
MTTASVATTVVSRAAVEVVTAGYAFAHGREPRGRGAWAFGPDRVTPISGCFWAFGPFASARREAVAHFAALGVRTVWVQS